MQELSLAIFPGEFVGVLGPNGSGKSTLLGCCTGLVPARQGTVCLGKTPVHALSARSRAQRVAFMPQRVASLPMLTAFAFARMGRYAHTPFLGGYTSRDNHVVWRSLAAAGAQHLGQRFISHLSGGELQRVLLARALAQEAPLLLLDEVTAGLDPACQVTMMHMLAQRVHQHQLGVVAALHDINLAASYCTRLIFLQKGHIVAQGTVQEVFTQAVLEQVYETPITLITHPATGAPQALLTAPTHTPKLPHE
nr:ABC transporter ATP-binding protein [Desulfovibrio cuneatus]